MTERVYAKHCPQAMDAAVDMIAGNRLRTKGVPKPVRVKGVVKRPARARWSVPAHAPRDIQTTVVGLGLMTHDLVGAQYAVPDVITIQHTKEALSRAVILAIMARAGLNLSINHEFDYGIDCTIYRLRPSVPGSKRSISDGFPIDLQLKSTANWRYDENEIVYEMEIDTWNDLIGRHPKANPLYLGLLCLPRDEAFWLDCREEHTMLQHCLYFLRPIEGEPSDNRRSYTVRIPRQNLLTPASLTALLDEARASALGRV